MSDISLLMRFVDEWSKAETAEIVALQRLAAAEKENATLKTKVAALEYRIECMEDGRPD